MPLIGDGLMPRDQPSVVGRHSLDLAVRLVPLKLALPAWPPHGGVRRRAAARRGDRQGKQGGGSGKAADRPPSTQRSPFGLVTWAGE